MLPCTQCGNTVVVDDGQSYVRCFNCNQMAYAANNQLVPYLRLSPQIDLTEAGATMRRWFASEAAPAGLQGVAMMGQPKAYDFMFWSFSGGNVGFDRQVMVPAVSTVLRELYGLSVPSHFINPDAAIEVEEEAVVPTVGRERAMAQAGVSGGENVQAWLVRVPLYEFPYQFNGRAFRVIVDGLAGQCLVDRFPRKPVSTWLVFLLLGMAAFGIEGWILWGNGIGLALVYLLTAVPALLMTWLVMKRRREDRGDG